MKYPNEQPVTRPEESQILRGAVDTVFENSIRYRRDLRLFADDKRIIRNPHKGWFWHYIDNGMQHGTYRDRNETDYALASEFPALNHLYLRFDWSDIEKEKGVYDFSPLEDIMDRWGRYGMTFSLRMCSYESAPDMASATPEYIFREGAACYTIPGHPVQPDYGDPLFLERLEAFLEALGRQYNGDPRIECIDIGSYGTWGEGHTVEGDGVIYPTQVIKRHFDLHAKYFPDTFILCNDDHIIGRLAHGMPEVDDMLNYAAARGFGVQDDSICCDGYANDCGYDTMRAPWAYERLSAYAPSAVELAHYTYIKPQFADYFRGGFTIAEALKNARATFAGFHGYPRFWLAGEPWLTEYCANRLGYWFFIPHVDLPPMQNTAHNSMSVCVENRGWARPYYPMNVRLLFVGGNGQTVVECPGAGAELLKIGPSGSAEIELRPDLRGLAGGGYDVYIGLADAKTDRVIRPAMAADRERNGYYLLGRVDVASV